MRATCGRPCKRSRGQETQSPFISPWFSSLPLTTCTGVSDDDDFKYTRCLRDGPELNPHHTQGETGTVLSLASDPEPTSRLARTAALTCTVSQPAEFATALALSIVLAFVVSLCPRTARATTGRGPNLILVALPSLGL